MTSHACDPPRSPLPRRLLVTLLVLASAGPAALSGQQSSEGDDGPPSVDSRLLSGLTWRNIGPAFASGRIADVAIDPTNESVWYVAASSGGVWNTNNAGTTWSPIFDDYPSYSIGAIPPDPNNHLTLWFATREHHGQHSVGYGDGTYKSLDHGRSFTHIGLETSAHIA